MTIELRKRQFAQMLERKLEQGYVIEAQSTTQAVLLTKRRRRLFGLLQIDKAGRHITSMDEHGKITTRKIDPTGRRERNDSG